MANSDIKNLEKMLKALANKRRLYILRYLKSKKEASVGDIAGKIHLSFKSTSRHLSVLSILDILEKEQRSSQVFYRISNNNDSILKHILDIL
ncbi:MAG: winged helix-turn-helix transcriptional regulator [Candidatus Pacebacteria bacterium]|nr:winged helix-turn-helix transcriptional regulator [Candidatus Paceibacterota bacterium]